MTRTTKGGGPGSFHELATLLTDRMGELTAAQQTIARRILADPEGVAFMSINDLAESAGVNAATVVRFANAVGLKGYPEVTALCRERLQRQAQLLGRFEAQHQLPSTGRDVLSLAAEFDRANVARTLSALDPRHWDEAVSLLATARRVHVMGLRKCSAVGTLLTYLLSLVRDDVFTVDLAAGCVADHMRRLSTDDVFVAISIYRYSRETVQCCEWARKNGVATLSITDNPASPLVGPSSIALFADTASPFVLRSLAGMISLVQALVAAASEQIGEAAGESLGRQEEALAYFDVYHAP